MIIKPSYIFNKAPSFHISGITSYFYNIDNKTILQSDTLTAFWCGTDEIMLKDDATFIYEQSGKVFTFKIVFMDFYLFKFKF